MESVIITASDGYRLSAIYFESTALTAGAIVLSSATGVKKEFYLNFAKWLARKGHRVLLFDYRGIGGSSARHIKKSAARMHEWGTKDMNAVLNWLVHEKNETGITWMGHSIGGQLFGFLQEKKHLKQVITVNAGLGHWGYFRFPMNMKIWALWNIVTPLLICIYGYGAAKKIGWGENLPKQVILEWRRWCNNRNYFAGMLQKKLRAPKFYDFHIPITAVYTDDDFIATDKTIPRMMAFFPNAPVELVKIPVSKYTTHVSGHTGMFRKRFENSLWPLLSAIIEGKNTRVQHATFSKRITETVLS